MAKDFKLDIEKKNFYKISKIVEKYDYKRFHRGGGKYVRELENRIIYNFIKLVYKNNFKFLDCPVGTGRSLPIIKKFSENILCVDTSEEMINYSKKKFPDVKTLNSSADQIKTKSNSINVFVSIRFLFHFKNLNPFFAEARRVLGPNGYYLFDVFNWSPRSLLKYKFLGGKTFNHNLKYISKMCKKYKFEIIKKKKLLFNSHIYFNFFT